MPGNIINNRIKSVGFRNLSSYTPSPLELRALKKGLNFVPMHTYTVSKHFRSDLEAAFNKYARVLHLRWHFRNNSDSIANIDKRSLIHKKLYIPSNWLPPINQRFVSFHDFLYSFIDSWSFPKFYLLIKIHKFPILGRPIISSVRWITTGLSKWLDYTLSPLLSQFPTVLKDTITLIRFLENLTLPDTFTLISLDVKNLYPSIPIMDGIDRVCELITPLLSPLAIRAIRQALLLVLTNNIVQFRNDFFLQLCGTAMGTNLAPSFANLFMVTIEHPVITKWKLLGHIVAYYRFIDDIFIIINGDSTIANKIICELNSQHPNIQLTGTISTSSVDFLDLTIFKGPRFISDHKLDIKVYSKPNNQFLYLPFTSFHARPHKISFLRGELLRFIRNCSQVEDFLRLIRKEFFHRLRARGYPVSIILAQFRNINYRDRLSFIFPSQNNPRKNTPLLFNFIHNASSVRFNFKKILLEHWNIISNDNNTVAPYFPDRPLIAYSRSKNIAERTLFASRKFCPRPAL